MKIISVVGARPNFIKVAPLHKAFQKYPSICSKIVHTGQHSDASMSDIFMHQLDLPKPDYCLGVNAKNTTRQTADLLLKFDDVLARERPDWVVVVGDVTSTFVCALAAAQKGVKVAHVEAGLRSGDFRMPEERNRRMTDALSDQLFVTEPAGVNNLRSEGIEPHRIHWVGNVMIDSLIQYRAKAAEQSIRSQLGLAPKAYALLTLHRATNVDTKSSLQTLLRLAQDVASVLPVVLPLHPRTRTNLIAFGLEDQLKAIPSVKILEPQGYLECLNLLENAAIVITDSGGIQEETTYLQVPCLTFRQSTERPITIELGTNQLIADLNPETAKRKVNEVLNGQIKIGQIPPLWDGQTAGRIARILLEAS